MRQQLGIIGCGQSAARHARAAQEGGFSVVACADPVAARAGKLAKATGAETARGAKSLLNRRDVDAVLIATPTPDHATLVAIAVERGVPVFCESPLTLKPADARILVQNARRKNVPLVISEPEAFHPGRNAVVEHVQARGLGNVGFIKTYRRSPYPKGQGRWYRDAAASGGLVSTKLIHDIAWVQRNFGKVTRVFAQGVQRPQGAGLEYVLATLTVENGIVAQCIGAWSDSLPPLQTLEVCAAGGMVQWNSDDDPIRLGTRKRAPGSSFRKKKLFVQQWRDFATFMNRPKSKDAWARTQSAVAALRVAEAISRSIESGSPVKV